MQAMPCERKRYINGLRTRVAKTARMETPKERRFCNHDDHDDHEKKPNLMVS
jgi:hypothetical protein